VPETVPETVSVLEKIQQPSLGRIVHYVLDGRGREPGGHRAAMITYVHGLAGDAGKGGLSCVDLFVFKSASADAGGSGTPGFGAPAVRYSAEPVENTWHWPEYVPASEQSFAPKVAAGS
jgi:hypothetical protein